MLSETDFLDAVAQLFPITGTRFRLELAGPELPAVWAEDTLVATVRLVIHDDDGSIRDVKEQTLDLLLAEDRTERGLAYLEAVAAYVQQLTFDDVETLMPSDLLGSGILATTLPTEAFGRVLADPRARMILERRPEDASLLATIDPAVRRGIPVLTNSALERRIVEHPDDPEAYAVYGDWLSQNGDPRGELVALQLAITRVPDEALAKRAEQLIHEHSFEWLGDLAWSAPGELALTWRYGFLKRISFGRPDEWSANERDTAVEIRTLAKLPGMAFMRELDIGPKEHWDDTVLATIGEVRLPPSTRTLSIETGEYHHLGDIEPAYPALAALEELRLVSRSMQLGTIELPSLRSCELVTRGLTKDNLASLRAASLPRLDRLVLWLGDEGVDNCDVELEDLEWILAGQGFAALRHLGLCGRNTPSLLERIVESSIVKRLEVLDLAGAYLDDADLVYLREHHAVFAHLRALHLFATEDGRVETVGPNVVSDERFIPVYE